MFEHLATESDSKCFLFCADNVTPLGVVDADGNLQQAYIVVRSRTSPAVRQHDLEVRRRLVNEARAEKGKAKQKEYDPEHDFRNGVAKLEVIISGWGNLPDGKGGEIPYSEATKSELAAMPELDYIHKQLFSHHNADENFMKAQPSY